MIGVETASQIQQNQPELDQATAWYEAAGGVKKRGYVFGFGSDTQHYFPEVAKQKSRHGESSSHVACDEKIEHLQQTNKEIIEQNKKIMELLQEEAIGARRKCCPSPEGFAAAITAETTTVPNRKLPPTSITIRLHSSADRKPPQPPPQAFADPTRRSLVCTYLWFADQHPLALGIKSSHLSYSQQRVYELVVHNPSSLSQSQMLAIIESDRGIEVLDGLTLASRSKDYIQSWHGRHGCSRPLVAVTPDVQIIDLPAASSLAIGEQSEDFWREEATDKEANSGIGLGDIDQRSTHNIKKFGQDDGSVKSEEYKRIGALGHGRCGQDYSCEEL
nr:uncharacterized protein LOC109151331 [Ipomoea trifida]